MDAKRSWWWSPGVWTAAIVVVAAALRLVHINWDQGHFFHPDERAVAFAVQRLSLRPFHWDPDFFAYGSAPIYLAKLVSAAIGVVDPQAAGYDGVILVGRELSAVFGALTVLLLILLGRRLYDRSVGLLAGVLLAVCVLHVQNSRFLTVDVPLTFVVLLALFQLVRVCSDGRPSQFILAGICIGVATATKFSAMPLFLPLAVAALARYRVEGRAASLAGRCALAAAAAVLAFAVAEPYGLIRFDRFYHDIFEQSQMVRHAGAYPYTTQYMHTVKYWYDVQQLVVWGMAPLLGAVAVWASLIRPAVAWRRRRPEDWVLLSWVVPFFLITGWFQVKFPRYLLPIYPLMILWAADWLVEKYRRGTLLGRAAAPVVVAGTALAAAAFTATYTRPHTVVTASEWVYGHLPPGSKILSQNWDEGFPFSLPGHNAAVYRVEDFGYYEQPDGSAKMARLSQELASSDYIVFQTKRLYGAVTRAPEVYPLTTNYFHELFAGDLGYRLIYEAASRPSLFGIQIPDELADESLTVYDHPKVLIFKNTGHLSAAVLFDKIVRGLPSRVLTRDDLLLAGPRGGASWESVGEAPPLQSSLPALLLFAALVEVLSLAAYALLRHWLDGVGTLALSKTLGVLVFAYVSWLLVSLGWAGFTQGTLSFVVVVLLAAGVLMWRRAALSPMSRAEVLATEGLFWGAFAFFLCVRAFNPEIYWGEKPMDFSFLNALTRTTTLPPPEPWFAGSPLYYSYFGYYISAALGKVLHLDPALTFNLSIALYAALTAAAAFAAGAVVTNRWQTGLLAAFFTVGIGNLAGPRELLSRAPRFGQHWLPAMNFDYFWATSRVIKDTINEFPFWSFLFADLHAHVMVLCTSLTFVCLAVLWVRTVVVRPAEPRPLGTVPLLLALLCLTLGAILVTNTWSAPTYILFFVFLVGALWLTEAGELGVVGGLFDATVRLLLPCGIVVGGAVLFFLPYWQHFASPEHNVGWERSFVSGLAQPGDFLTIFGLFLCALVPFVFVLWVRNLRRAGEPMHVGGMALVGAAAAVPLVSLRVSTRALMAVLFLLGLQVLLARQTERRWRIPVAMATFAFAVTAGCDLVYVWDRMNTLFKFYMESWLLMAVASAAVVPAAWADGRSPVGAGMRRVWQVAFGGLLAVALFTAVTDTHGILVTHRVPTPAPTLNGMAYLQLKAPDELAAYTWLNRHVRGIPVLLEAHGDSYQEFTRVSMNTGLPTVLGWSYHVFQRAHPMFEIDRRAADIRTAYTSDNKDVVTAILNRYHVALVFVGALERRTYAGANLERFKEWSDLLTPIYQNPGVTIFAVNGRFTGTMPVTTIEALPQVAGEAAPPPPGAPGTLHQPRGLAVLPGGAVLVCDFGNDRMQLFGPDLRFLRGWGSHGQLPGQFNQPCGVAVGPGGEMFVVDTWNQRVQVFSKDFKYAREWAAGFYGPRGIAVDAQGSVYVSDTGNNRVVRFSAAGQREREWGTKGTAAGQFAEPTGITVDAAGKVYVCDNGNGRLQMFTRDGQFLAAFPVPGWESKVYSEPTITLDPSGRIWVTVPTAKEVRAYAPSGQLLRTVTSRSLPEVSFDTPMGIAYDPAVRALIITDLDGRLARIPYEGR